MRKDGPTRSFPLSPALAMDPEIGYSSRRDGEMRKLLLPLIGVICLCSCVGIESRLVVRADGSGTLDLTYRVSQMIADLGRSGSEKVDLPLPVTKEDFERGLQGVSGVRVSGFSRAENEKDITIHVQLSFDSIDSLSRVAAFHGESLSLSTSGTRHTFTQLVTKAETEEMSQDSLQMLDTFFDGYSISLAIEAPSPIQAYTIGKLSTDKRTLTYTASVKELVTAKSDVVLSLSW
jgi:hypothetical protein